MIPDTDGAISGDDESSEETAENSLPERERLDENELLAEASGPEENGSGENRSSGEMETIRRFLALGMQTGTPSSSSEPSSDPPGEARSEPAEPAAVAIEKSRTEILESARSLLDKRRNEMRMRASELRYGPQGEAKSEIIAKRIELIDLGFIRPDSTFSNLRREVADTELDELMDSMKHEGLKNPITVICAQGNNGWFHVRAGFRRTKAARLLGWKRIPAIVLPADTPEAEEYWTNIVENSLRSKLSSYEVACAARMMRGRFGVSPRDFALRAGYSESYVQNLLRCLDRLPDEIIAVWEDKAPIPTDMYIAWAKLRPEEAIKAMLTFQSRNPRIMKGWKPPAEVREKTKTIRMASSTGLQRMQRVRFAIEVCRKLEPKTREVCVQIVDFCSGARDDVPGVYDPQARQRIYKSRRREDLPLPAPGEEIAMPSLPTPPHPKADDDE